MIRFLQAKDNQIVKAIFIVIISVVSVGMVIYLIPGLTGMGASTADTYATIYPHWYSKLLSSGTTVSLQKVQQLAHQQAERQKLPDSPFITNYFVQQEGAQQVRLQVLLIEADKLGIKATDADVTKFLHAGQFGQFLFPNGQFIGEDRYASFVANQFNLSVMAFEEEVKHDIQIRRLETLVTAGVRVNDSDVRASYLKQNVKIKFDYAVISSDDLRKTINPSDNDLESFFKKNGARYASAVPEQRQITYVTFTPNEIPGGLQPPTQQEIQQYFAQHQAEYSVPDQARARHILIKVAPGDAKADAAAKAKAEGLLKQIQSGGNFADLARTNSDDPGSKDKGGELGFAPRKAMVPEFDNAIFTQKIGDSKIVKTSFGYHIVQVEERQTAHSQSINEVLPTIQATLFRQKAAKAQQDYAQALTSEAIRSGLAKTAAAHHLELVNSPLVSSQGVISALADSTQMVQKAFASKQGDPAQFASVGEGFAIFQVTGIAPSHAPSFTDWKSHVADDYRSELLPNLMTQKAKELADKAKAENDLAKAAKEVGAVVKSSELVGASGQVPDFGQVGQVAPQLFDLSVGGFSGPINAGRTAVVAKIVDKQQPSADEIAKNLDQTRDQLLDRRRAEAFNVFLSTVMDDYKKHNRILIMKSKGEETPGL